MAELLQLLKAFEQAPEASSHALLREALPYALAPCPAGQAPHRFQEELIACARQALATQRAAAEQELAKEEAAAEDARGHLKEAEAEDARAQEAIVKANAVVADKIVVKDVAEADVMQETARHASTEKACSGTLQAHTELLASKTEIELLTSTMQQHDDDPTGEGNSSVALIAFLERKRAEKPLVAALPAALSLPPAARSTFDQMVVAEVKRIMKEELDSVERDIAAGAEQAGHAEAERLGAWAILDTARDQAMVAQADLGATELALQEARVAQRGTAAEVRAKGEEVQLALARQALAEARREELVGAERGLEILVKKSVVEQETMKKVPLPEGTAAVPMEVEPSASAGA